MFEFISLDGVVQAPGGQDEDRDGGFAHGGWTVPHWHDDIGVAFFQAMQNVDAFLLGPRTYETQARAFEPMARGDPFGDAGGRDGLRERHLTRVTPSIASSSASSDLSA